MVKLSKEAKQELESLFAGLRHLESCKGQAQTYAAHERIAQKIETKKKEIEKFKLGYKLGAQERATQQTLD